jgi:hypothetical protein
MNKPTKITTSYYDFSAISEYIEFKLQRHLRDWNGKFRPHEDSDQEHDAAYLDFWHWLIDIDAMPGNDSMALFPGLEEVEDRWHGKDTEWIKTIVKTFWEEFPDLQTVPVLYSW